MVKQKKRMVDDGKFQKLKNHEYQPEATKTHKNTFEILWKIMKPIKTRERESTYSLSGRIANMYELLLLNAFVINVNDFARLRE